MQIMGACQSYKDMPSLEEDTPMQIFECGQQTI